MKRKKRIDLDDKKGKRFPEEHDSSSSSSSNINNSNHESVTFKSKRRQRVTGEELHDNTCTTVQPGESTTVVTKGKTSDENHISILPENKLDQGHRYGNFKNYYSFHPSKNRVHMLDDILDYITTNVDLYNNQCQVNESSNNKKTVKDKQQQEQMETLQQSHFVSEKNNDKNNNNLSFSYCDVGCNEGDLTIELSKAIQKRLLASDDDRKIQIDVVGVDIDETLIQRANTRFHNNNNNNNTKSSNDNSNYNFVQANVIDLEEINNKIPNNVHLLSLFSTSMWLHIHAGDDKFRDILKHLCRKTQKFILIEPQPSKCYRNAMIRLRKMGLVEFDVSIERLQLRQNIEIEIDKIMFENKFQKIKETSMSDWNRSVRLYERLS